jgi:hypothetical protein
MNAQCQIGGRDSSVGITPAADSTVRETYPGESEIFRIRPERPWGPHSSLYDGYRVSSPEVKRPGRGVDYPPLNNPYLYFPSRPLWPVSG